MQLKKALFRKGFNNFITDIVEQFHVTRDEVMDVISHFGDFRSKVYTYFLVRAYQQRKGLRIEGARESVVNRWFP